MSEDRPISRIPPESSNGFAARHRWALALSTVLGAILLLVLVYRFTAPGARTTSSSREALPEGDVLRVGALPVT
ncbi:MAG TPA: hypothetical protein VJZ25_01085 [Gemmatimonadaceae bacterium]|nr:hypothetical protein [Gemmatimonadaceae bacterium]